MTSPSPSSTSNTPQQQSYNIDHALPGLLDTDLYPAVGSPSVTIQIPTEPSLRRKVSTAPENYDDASRLAAEEDKRRRSTVASARSRVKKRQHEQALMKSAKEMSDKVQALENRIYQLETENKWLKNLCIEWGERKQNDGEDVAAL
jgi:hypothetical protein